MKNDSYVKLFSRDFSLPSVEIWMRGESSNPKEWTNKTQPFLPYEVAERADNTVHFYYSLKGVEWACNILLEISHTDKDFISYIEKKVIEKLGFIKPIYEKEEAVPYSTLKRFLREFEAGFSWFEAMWLFTEWMINEMPKELEGLDITNLEKLRVSTENLLGSSDSVIREALKKMYPNLGHLSSVLTIDELLAGTIPNKEVLEKRYSGYFFVQNQLFIDVDKSDIEEKFGMSFEHNDIKKVRELSGMPAFRGVVRGFVKRVMGHEQIDTFKEGEILVAPMTIPDFLPAVKKAAAIVTDEGGVLSHAAIVAREFEKPSVVGTHIATKRLQDGDIVEVNAHEGKVTLICHASIVANRLKKPCVVGTRFATDIFEDGDYVEVDADKGIITLINKKNGMSKWKKTMPWNALFE